MIDFGCKTDAGCVRTNNEDSFGCAPELKLFVLSDGMGGLESGEVASRLAVETILAHCRQAHADSSMPLVGGAMEGVCDISARLGNAIRLANRLIHETAQKNPANQKMGATVVAAELADEQMSFAHVGDSRIYCLRDGRLKQLTQDHSFVAEQMREGNMTNGEAAESKLHNVLTRALGVDPEVEVDIGEERLMQGDTILLCSDGLTRELSDAQIAGVLSDAEEAQEAADQLVTLAIQAGGGDNVTAIVVQPTARPVGAFSRIGRWGKWFKGR